MENTESGTMNPELKGASNPKPLSDSTLKTMRIFSLIASGMLAIGFLLPWVASFEFDREMPTINGITLVNGVFNLLGEESEFIIFLLPALFLISIPVFATVFFFTRLNKGFANFRLGTVCFAFSSFVPLLLTAILNFGQTGRRGLTGEINEFYRDGGHLGIGFNLMAIGALYLLVETLILLNKGTGTRDKIGAGWVLATVFGVIIGVVITLANHFFEDADDMVLILLFLSIFILLIPGVMIPVSLHKNKHLKGTITFERAVGIGVATSLIAGFVAFVGIVSSSHESGEIYYSGFSKLFVVFLVLCVQIGLIWSSIAATIFSKGGVDVAKSTTVTPFIHP